MSRSRKKPIVTSSPKIDKDFAHKRVRRRVKVELGKPEPDEELLELDIRGMGQEEFGTKLDFSLCDEETVDKCSRK
jgi:hypothetical protein